MSFNYGNQYSNSPVGGMLDTTFFAVMQRVYAWMALGLFLTAGVAYIVAHSPLVLLIASNPFLFYGLIIGELGLVIAISYGINKMSPTLAMGLFLLYAAVNGMTLAFILLVYTGASIALTFSATAALFGVMSVVGYTTKMDLSRFGSYLMMALIGLIVASVVNIFWANSTLEWIITYAGILIFLGLTIYDTKRIKEMTLAAMYRGDELVVNRVGIIGALRLYLDFINLFLYLLRLLGRRR